MYLDLDLVSEEISNKLIKQGYIWDAIKEPYEILIEKATEKLYIILKKEKLIPDIPNVKALWAEQFRKIKLKDWEDIIQLLIKILFYVVSVLLLFY